MSVFFTSDLHFGHANIIGACHRPFSSVEEMDATMIKNWNRKVKKGDTVCILGDLCHHASPEPYLKALNGRKILVCGNHDVSWAESGEYDSFFQSISQMVECQIQHRMVTMCHYPMLEWRNSRKRRSSKLGYLLHGHIHNLYSEDYRILFIQENALNVGAEVNHYEPVTFEELKQNNLHFKFHTLPSAADKALLLVRTFHNGEGEKYGSDQEKQLLEDVKKAGSEREKVELLLSDIESEIEKSTELQTMVNEIFCQL